MNYFTLLVLVKKNRHSSALIECQIQLYEATFTCKIKCSSFLLYASFLDKYIMAKKRNFFKFLIFNLGGE